MMFVEENENNQEVLSGNMHNIFLIKKSISC